jgi:hypothetical protein
MAKLGAMTLTGQSGQKYQFDVYPLTTTFKAVGAVYYISKRTPKQDGGGDHSKIYIGQTGDLSDRFDNHHKADCFEKRGANCISVHTDDDEDSRLTKEADLIDAYKPPCND